MHLWNKCYSFPINSWFQLTRFFRLVFICKRFQSRLQVGYLKSRMAFHGVLLMSRRLRYLLRMCNNWLNPCSTTYIVGNTSSNICFTFPQSSEKRLLQLMRKSGHPRERHIARAPSSYWMSTRRSHSLMLVLLAKSISPSHFLRNPMSGVISTIECLLTRA